MKTITPIRKLMRLTQHQLAARLECSQSLIAGYERGFWTISPAKALQLVRVAADAGVALTLDQVYGIAPLPEAPPAGADAPEERKAA